MENIDLSNEKYPAITQKITESRERLKLLAESIYDPKLDDKRLEILEESLKEIQDANLIEEQKNSSVIYEGNQTFKDWEATIDKNKVTRLEIESSLKDNKLIIKDYPNLKELYAPNRNLKKAEINAPKLKILNLSNNDLKKLDVNNITSLKELTINNNKELAEIDGFEKLTDLETLNCFDCKFKELNCSNKDKLTDVFAANQFVTEFKPNFQGCTSLVNLDVAENNITNLDCSNL